MAEVEKPVQLKKALTGQIPSVSNDARLLAPLILRFHRMRRFAGALSALPPRQPPGTFSAQPDQLVKGPSDAAPAVTDDDKRHKDQSLRRRWICRKRHRTMHGDPRCRLSNSHNKASDCHMGI